MRTTLVLMGALILLDGSAVALGQSTKSAPPGRLEVGKNLYVAKCQTCHGIKGEGGGAQLEKVLGARPKSLRSPDVQRKSNDEIATAVRSGTGKMKPVEGLTLAQVREIIAYVRTLRDD